MVESLKFRESLVTLILSGDKSITWRLWDERDLKVGDEFSLVKWENGEVFAQAQILAIREKKIGEFEEEDFRGHEEFDTWEGIYAAYSNYYGRPVDAETPAKVIKFKLIDISHSP